MKEVMELNELNTAKVLTAEPRLPNQPVELVSIIEAPVDVFERQNEFVLTTGIGCGSDPALFKGFVQDIIDSKAAALGIATGCYIFDIPPETLRLAEEHQFPMIQIPWNVRFAHITQAILGKLNNWHRIVLERSEEMQRQLLQVFLEGADYSEAVEIIYQRVGRPVVIIDHEGRIKGESSNSSGLVTKWSHHSRSLSGPLTVDPFPIPQYPPKTDAGWFMLKDQSALLVPIRSAHKIQGYLLFSLPDGTSADPSLGKAEEQLLEYAVTSVALWFQREYSIQETEMRLRGDFVWNLATGQRDSWDRVLSQAKALDYELMLPYVCILGLPENFNELAEQKSPDPLFHQHWLQGSILSVEKQLHEAAKALHRKTMITFFQDQFIIYLEVPMNNVKESVDAFLDLAEMKVQRSLPGLVLSWGIGENHAGVKTFHESFQDAQVAINIGRRQKGPGHRHTYASTDIFRILLSLADHPDLQKMTLSTVGVLIDYDQQRGLDLFKTLSVYIRNRGNISKTARDLFLHRQSLHYRLQKIESLTGRSLVDPDDIFLMDLSIKLWNTGISQT